MLDRCLLAMQHLDLPSDEFEVLVVDDGSVHSPNEVFARYAGTLPLRTFRTSGLGPARARNLALRHARGDYAVFTDDDCAPHPHWLRAYQEAFAKTPGAGLGGPIVDAPENSIFGRASQALVSFLYEYFAAPHPLSFFCSNNFAFPRAPLLELGGFDESCPLPAAEDRDLGARWKQQGELRFVPDAVIVHRQSLSLWTFCRQQYRYGKGAFQFWHRRRNAGGPGNRLEPLQFYSAMLRYPFRRERLPRALAISLLFVASQAATALGYLRERLKFGRPPGLGKRPVP
jgi:cellulose synthase/poly-beta-1,6-N-acetylglucosamine synthase-like glycosyltransferase